jgi:hypothetical protein
MRGRWGATDSRDTFIFLASRIDQTSEQMNSIVFIAKNGFFIND